MSLESEPLREAEKCHLHSCPTTVTSGDSLQETEWALNFSSLKLLFSVQNKGQDSPLQAVLNKPFLDTSHPLQLLCCYSSNEIPQVKRAQKLRGKGI